MAYQQGSTTHVDRSSVKQMRGLSKMQRFKRNKNENLLSYSESNWPHDKKIKETKSQQICYTSFMQLS